MFLWHVQLLDNHHAIIQSSQLLTYITGKRKKNKQTKNQFCQWQWRDMTMRFTLLSGHNCWKSESQETVMQQTVESINKFVKIQYILKGESGLNLSLMAKVLCKPRFDFPCFENPRFENPHFITGRCKTGKSKSARIGPYSKFQKYFHDWPAPRHHPWICFWNLE